MSYETFTTVSNILNSKNGPLYAGMASIVVLTLAHMLTENNYNISGSSGNITTFNTSNLAETSTKS